MSAKHLAAIEKKKAKEAAKKAEKEARKKAKEEGKEITGPSAAELAKQERLAKRQAQEAGYQKDPNDPAAHLFGDLEICRSQMPAEKRYERVYSEIKDIDESKIDQEVWIRARVHGVRG